MKSDIHVVYSEAPLPENVNHLAACGKVVHKARLAFLWDEQEMGQPLNLGARGICRDCYYEPPPNVGVYLVYGFKEGEK